MEEMRSRVQRITNDLNMLLDQLAAVREEDSRKLIEEVLTPEIIRAFKSSVDAMWRALWFYIEAAARQSSSAEGNLTLQNVVDALRNLRYAEAPVATEASSGSFIEKVAAIVDKKMPAHED